MPPLASPPTRGYPDGQRVENWDSPVLYSSQNVNITASEITPVLDVSRYAYLGGFDTVGFADLAVTIIWYTSAAATTGTGAVEYQMSQTIALPAQYRLPNLGPYVRLEWDLLGPGTAVHTVRLIGTNRTHPLQLIPRKPELISQQNVSQNADTQIAVYPTDYYAGPVDIWLDAPGAGWSIVLQHLNLADTWDFDWQSTPTTVAGLQQFKVVTPPGAWRILVINGSASTANYYLNVRYTLTGGT